MKHTLLIAAGALWIGASAAGMAVLWEYAHRPGSSSSAPPDWPTSVRRDALALQHPTLLVFLHPECPCSRATVAELARVAARAASPLSIRVYVHDSTNFEQPAKKGTLWKAASRIPGVQVLVDKEGALARAFGADTSGASLLYDRTGRLLFEGGITGARGHEGENANEDVLLACLQGTLAGPIRTQTFGCSIF